jgi:hypothetical protein
MIYEYNKDCKLLEAYARSLGFAIEVTAVRYRDAWEFEATEPGKYTVNLGRGYKAAINLRDLLQLKLDTSYRKAKV